MVDENKTNQVKVEDKPKTDIQISNETKKNSLLGFAKTNDSNNQKNDRNNGKNRKVFKKEENIYLEKVVAVNRVTKVTKGGRRFRFGAVVVVGDRKGQVGLGTGKANEVPDAIKKAIKNAKRDLIKISTVGTTVPHEIVGHFGSGRVLIKPARKGTGVIAGGPARAVIECVGVADVYVKSLGSNTPINMIRATLEGLSNMVTAEKIQHLRANKKSAPNKIKTESTTK